MSYPQVQLHIDGRWIGKVQRSIYPAFREAFVAGERALKIGAGLDDGVQMGPLVAQRRVDEMSRLVDDAVAQGAGLLCGGKPAARPGFFYEATVLEDSGMGSESGLEGLLEYTEIKFVSVAA